MEGAKNVEKAPIQNTNIVFEGGGTLTVTKDNVPRLCHIKRPNNIGYGFKVQPSKASTSHHYISNVDKNSPADNAGLCKGDRILEVNGVNISQENHKEVIQRIKAVPNMVNLLVVDKTTDSFHKQNNLMVKGEKGSFVTYK